MKNKQKNLTLFGVLFLVSLICFAQEITQISVKGPKEYLLEVGEWIHPELIILPANTKGEIKVTVSDPSALHIAGTSLCALHPRKEAIKATFSIAGAQTEISIKIKENSYPAKSIAILPTEHLKLAIGEKKQLTTLIYPEQARGQEVQWYADSPRVRITKTGEVVGLGPGTTTIRARVRGKDGFNIESTILVTVYQVPVKLERLSIEVEKPLKQLLVGEKLKLWATAFPAAANLMPVWTSSNQELAIVDSEGMVMARSAGKVVIMLEDQATKKKAEFLITITDPQEQTAIKLSIPRLKAFPKGASKGEKIPLLWENLNTSEILKYEFTNEKGELVNDGATIQNNVLSLHKEGQIYLHIYLQNKRWKKLTYGLKVYAPKQTK